MTDLPPFSTYFTILPGQTDPFYHYHFRVASPPALHYRDLAFGFVCPPTSGFNSQGYPLSSNSSPSRSVRCSHSTALSAPPSRPPTSVVIRYFRSGCTACSFPSRLATHLFSGRHCHPIPSAWSSFLRILLSLRHLLHLVYK